MKRIPFAAFALLVAPLGCEPVATDPVVEQQPAPEFAVGQAVTGSVTGSAHLTALTGVPQPGLATRNFTLSARAHGDGSVDGEWQVVVGATILHGAVDCLTIAPDGGSARVSGVVTRALFALFQPGTAFAMELHDNGSGSSGEPDVSTQLRAFRNADPAVGRAFCETGVVPAGAALDPLPTEEGNFTIRVAQ